MEAVHPLHGNAVGHLMVIADDSPVQIPDDCIGIDVREFADQLATAAADGTLLILRLLVPMVPFPTDMRGEMEVLVGGVGADFAAHCTRQIGVEQISDQVAAANSGQAANSNGGRFHRAFFGCGGKVPSVSELLPMLEQLRPDGQFGLYGLPSAQLSDIQKSLSDCDFSMRSGGVDGEFGFLSGSMESLKKLRSKGTLV